MQEITQERISKYYDDDVDSRNLKQEELNRLIEEEKIELVKMSSDDYSDMHWIHHSSREDAYQACADFYQKNPQLPNCRIIECAAPEYLCGMFAVYHDNLVIGECYSPIDLNMYLEPAPHNEYNDSTLKNHDGEPMQAFVYPLIGQEEILTEPCPVYLHHTLKTYVYAQTKASVTVSIKDPRKLRIGFVDVPAKTIHMIRMTDLNASTSNNANVGYHITKNSNGEWHGGWQPTEVSKGEKN